MKFKKLTSLALSAALMTGLMTRCGTTKSASTEEIVTEISTEDMELVIPFENTELSEESTEENN